MKRWPGLILFALFMVVLSNAAFLLFTQSFPKEFLNQSPSYWFNIITSIYWLLIVIIVPWIGLLPVMIRTLNRYQLRTNNLGRFVALHIAICFAFSLLQIVVHMLFELDAGMFYYGDMLYRLVSGIMFYFGYNVIFYIAVATTYLAYITFRQLKQREISEARLAENLANARLNSLKMKLQPHFLFNALQSINVLVLDQETDPASEMIEKLSILLRLSIDRTDNQLETVEKELEMLDHYLAIERIRYKDRLSIEQTIKPEVNKALVPSLILQPLIENSLKHGIAKCIEPGKIRIGIRRNGKNLIISIANDGPRLPEGWSIEHNSGIGLKTTLSRLELLFGDSCSLTMKNTSGGVATELTIPFSEEVLNTDEGSAR